MFSIDGQAKEVLSNRLFSLGESDASWGPEDCCGEVREGTNLPRATKKLSKVEVWKLL